MNIGHINSGNGPHDAAKLTSQTASSASDVAKRARLAQGDRAIISGPARERHLEVSRLLGKLESTEVGKSEAELASLKDRLESGAFDHAIEIEKAAERLIGG